MKKTTLRLKKIMCSVITVSFLTSLIVTPCGAQVLPMPGAVVGLSAGFQPPVLLGLKIHPENPLLFDFIVDQGQSQLSEDELKIETEKLVKYFLAALTIPDKEVWVNLSPYEKDRIIPDLLAETIMGKTMLEQDYVLKQLASSLTNPDEKLGQEYWAKVKAETQAKLGTTDIAMNTFNKVWIVPSKAEVLESNGIVLVGEKRLKLMMADDYEAARMSSAGDSAQGLTTKALANDSHRVSSSVFRATILPNIEKEVNEGKNFADVRQIYNSVILATWYKKALKESLLGKVYADKGKVAGVQTDDKEMKQRIYEQYLAAFKTGVYNVIKEEEDASGDLIPRKYFSGGEALAIPDDLMTVRVSSPAEVERRLKASSTISFATVRGTEPEESATIRAKTITASSGVDRNQQIFQKKIKAFNDAVIQYGRERIDRAYTTIEWWASQTGYYRPYMLVDQLDEVIRTTTDIRTADPVFIKEFLSFVRVLLNNAAQGDLDGRERVVELLSNNYDKFSSLYDFLFHDKVTYPTAGRVISSHVVNTTFHKDLFRAADAILTDEQKQRFISGYQKDFPGLKNFFLLESWVIQQDRRKTGSGKVLNGLIAFTREKIKEAWQANVQAIQKNTVENIQDQKAQAELAAVHQAADELLLYSENVVPSLKGFAYGEMATAYVLLMREIIYWGYYVYLQDDDVATAMERKLDQDLYAHLTTVEIRKGVTLNLAQVYQTVENLGFDQDGEPSAAFKGPLQETLEILKRLSASSSIRLTDKVQTKLEKIKSQLKPGDPVADVLTENLVINALNRIWLDVLARNLASDYKDVADARLKTKNFNKETQNALVLIAGEVFQMRPENDYFVFRIKDNVQPKGRNATYFEFLSALKEYGYILPSVGGVEEALAQANSVKFDKNISLEAAEILIRQAGVMSKSAAQVPLSAVLTFARNVKEGVKKSATYSSATLSVALERVNKWIDNLKGDQGLNAQYPDVLNELAPARGRGGLRASLINSISIRQQQGEDQLFGDDKKFNIALEWAKKVKEGEYLSIEAAELILQYALDHPGANTQVPLVVLATILETHRRDPERYVGQRSSLLQGAYARLDAGQREKVLQEQPSLVSNRRILASLEQVSVSDPKGLHLRPSAQLVKIATEYNSKFEIILTTSQGRQFPAHDIFAVISSRVAIGYVLTIEVFLKDGVKDSGEIRSQAQEVITQIKDVFARIYPDSPAESHDQASSSASEPNKDIRIQLPREVSLGTDEFKSWVRQGKITWGTRIVEVQHYVNPTEVFVEKDKVITDFEFDEKGTLMAIMISDMKNPRIETQVNLAQMPVGIIIETASTASSPAIAEPVLNPGGIDFDPSAMNLQIKRDGKGVPLPLFLQNVEQINIDGLTPVIINIVPVNAQNLPIFLGHVKGDRHPQEASREPELASKPSG